MDYNWKFPSFKKVSDDMPIVKPLNPAVGLAIFSGMALIGVSIGASIATYVFFGTATLVGLMVLIESNKHLKWIAVKSNRGIDILIFSATLYATASLGVTVSAALVFAGLGYSLVYAPYLRATKRPSLF